MTVLEFSNEFDILYNSISSNTAPSIDLYEKSVYLTKAQLEIVKNYFDPDSNRKRKGFEMSEKRKNDLEQIVKDYKTNTIIINQQNISDKSKFVVIPENTFLIVSEKLQIDTNCGKKNILVRPITNDEYFFIEENPFKLANKQRAYRLNFSKVQNLKVVEIISSYNTFSYQMRYVEFPNPIILTDLEETYPNDNLSINGITTPQTCVLNESIHQEILDRAVELAYADYKTQNLETKVQINTRNE